VVQKDYFHRHGTTLTGLMADHDVDPHEFLAEVHDIEMDVLEHDAPLAAAIASLPGRKLVFTNGDKPYALKVLDRLGLGDAFEAIHDIHAMDRTRRPMPICARGWRSSRPARCSSRTWRAISRPPRRSA
jgi:putative hydrolase of the HAD superfamily